MLSGVWINFSSPMDEIASKKSADVREVTEQGRMWQSQGQKPGGILFLPTPIHS